MAVEASFTTDCRVGSKETPWRLSHADRHDMSKIVRMIPSRIENVAQSFVLRTPTYDFTDVWVVHYEDITVINLTRYPFLKLGENIFIRDYRQGRIYTIVEKNGCIIYIP